ncbi:MAG: hypothetical protein SFW09_21280 [Hyphomicrobiaceae bacterium]|nr:hypothetical protein [Hyphomicrobiaceae bacterium]
MIPSPQPPRLPRPGSSAVWPVGLAIVAWPLLLLGLIELGLQSELALVGLAVVSLAVPALAVAGGARLLPHPVVPNGAARLGALPQAARGHRRPRRPARIVTPAACCHCGRMPTTPRRSPRILRRQPRRTPRIVSRAMPARTGRPSEAQIRAPRIVSRH